MCTIMHICERHHGARVVKTAAVNKHLTDTVDVLLWKCFSTNLGDSYGGFLWPALALLQFYLFLFLPVEEHVILRHPCCYSCREALNSSLIPTQLHELKVESTQVLCREWNSLSSKSSALTTINQNCYFPSRKQWLEAAQAASLTPNSSWSSSSANQCWDGASVRNVPPGGSTRPFDLHRPREAQAFRSSTS